MRGKVRKYFAKICYSFFYLLENENRYSLEQLVSYRHGRHVEDKALSRQVRYETISDFYCIKSIIL